MIKKIANLKGRIDCPKCFSLLEWDNAKDIKVSNGNKYIICPECGQSLVLKKGKDYWEEVNSSGGDSSDFSIANVTLINNTDTLRSLSIALQSQAHDGAPDMSHWNIVVSGNGGTAELKVILYHGEAVGLFDIPLKGPDYVRPNSVAVTGDITADTQTVTVNGDGTITLS